jgi:PAS domain S-box-containing protein
MLREEDSLAVGRSAGVRTAMRIAVLTNFLAGLLAICFVILAGRAIGRDFKERIQVEAERDRFFTLSLDLLCIAKSDGYFKRINPAFTAVLGWSPEELLSKPFIEFVHPDDRAATLREVERQTIAGEPVLRFENRYRHRNGSWRVLSWRSVPQPGGLMFASARDVTDVQAAHSALEAAKEAADVANRAKSDFLAKMSHELRTPLNSIIGFSEILEAESGGPLTDKQRRFVANVLTSGRSLLQLINDILDLSKVEAGRMELILAPFNPGDALSQTQELVAPLADKKGLSLELSVPSALPPVQADQTRIEQILYNLLSNAIKFTPEGGQVRVTARLLRDPSFGSGPDELEIAVSDTGIGIAPKDLERIFQEFEQVGSDSRQNSQGTGLGLALSRKLVELHGGRLTVESAPGRGSTFRFSLPCVERRSSPRETLPPRDGAASRESSRLVLVVDDDHKARDLITHYLEQHGYRAACTAAGSDVLRLARDLKPDAITLDLILPGHNGLVLLAQLKADPETQHIPVVVVSVTERSELGYSLGAEDWLVKPVQQEVFLRVLDTATSSATGAGKRTILIVDDDPGAVEYLSELVHQHGCEVLSASNGREGVALALQHQPDAIILDLAMPEMNGFEAVKVLREDSRTRTTPILIVTAMTLTPAERQQLEAGVQGIVGKDWQSQLLGELSRLCHQTEVPA